MASKPTLAPEASNSMSAASRSALLTPKPKLLSKQGMTDLLSSTALVVVGISLLPALAAKQVWPSIKSLCRWLRRIGGKMFQNVMLWWITTRAIWQDRKKSVTDDPIIARLMLGRFAEDDGLFLTYAPAIPILGVPKRKLTLVEDRHVLVVGDSRAGKGTSFIVPGLLQHKGSLITFDPASENVNLTAAYRQQVLGQDIQVIDPFGTSDFPSASFNPLLEIDFDNDPQALDKCFAIAESLVEVSGNDTYWSNSAQGRA